MPRNFNELHEDVSGLKKELASVKNSMLGNGVTPENLQNFFAMHRHDGSVMGGQQLYGPYFLNDTVNGQRYQITSVNGVLTLTQVS